MEGGLLKGLSRAITGASMFLLRYRTLGGSGIVGFGGSVPGKIADLDVSKGDWIVQKTGYLASQPSVTISMELQKKVGNILFGGEGLILQRLSGPGIAFIAACGDFNIIDLKPGEVYKVSTANAVGWQSTVRMDITAAGGLKTALFGGEGLFVTTFTGPGKVILQSMTMADLAASLVPYLPSK
jgi:uncharacterized protein (AIM24 family)